jgi:hypothetical protein
MSDQGSPAREAKADVFSSDQGEHVLRLTAALFATAAVVQPADSFLSSNWLPWGHGVRVRLADPASASIASAV